MNNFLWALVLVVILGGAFFLWQMNSTTPVTPTPVPTMAPPPPFSTTPTPSPSPATGAPMTATVSYDGTKFTPSEVTIKKGGTVTWNGPASMEVASAVHPSHTGYDGTARAEHCATGAPSSFDQCEEGATYSFTFGKAGTWPYHDHKKASATGRVEVVE